MSELSKQALKVENNTQFPDNNSGAITPSDLRAFNVDMIDSTVNQAVYTADSSSWNNKIAALESFTGSQQPSFNALNAFTASQLSINTGVNAFTHSADARLDALENDTNNLELFTASVNQIADNGVVQGTSTRLHFYGLVSASIVPNVGGAIASINIEQDGTKLDSASFNAYTGSNNTKWDNLSPFTASLTASVQELLNMSASLSGGFVTEGELQAATQSLINQINTKLDSASFNTYTASNDTKWSNLGAQSGSWITESETGSFARLQGGNSFTGNQTINGDVIITGSDSNHLLFGRTGGADILRVGVSDNGNTYDITITGSTNQQLWLADNQGGTYINNFTAPIIAGNNVRFENGFTASLQQGYVWVGNASGKNEPVATSSFLDAVPLTSLNAYTQSNDTKWNTLGGLTGSYATTGSNVFTGDQTLVDSQGNSVTLSDASGSLMLVAKGYNSSSAHLVASGSSFVNLIFKDNNNNPDTIISGSNNIFPNPATPTAGFKRFIGSNNLMLNPIAVPQISGSMAFPVNVNANVFSHAVTNAMIIRGPVSSSAYDIRGNIVMHGILNIGSSAANNFEKAQAGLTMFGNSVFGGNILQIANKTVLTNAPLITNNLLFGATITLNHNSSSIAYTSNGQNGGIVVNNNFSPAVGTAAVALSPKVGINTVYGVGHSVTLDGTNVSTSQTKQFYANILAGLFLSASVPTGDSSNVLGVGMIGNSLTITGSSTVVGAASAYTPDNTQGSLFVGRFNAVNGNRAKTAETVFAVGTGTSTNRKTGFLIDSGSNTFVEGTLNVSGSTSTTGSITIQSGSGDLFVHGHKMFNVGAFQSNVTQSGSANVSQSVNFDTTDVSYGVTLSDNSRLNVANAGVYLITFSAQVLADTGADTFYIWLKKNGTNIAESASKLSLANNDAELATVTFVNEAAANDYYEICWQTTNGDGVLYTEAASGNVPAIPSIIITITQVR